MVERDSDVVALIAALGIFDQLPVAVRTKIRIVEGDALTWRAHESVDCVHADIWAPLLGPERWNEVRRIHANIGSDRLYFWGQELELHRLDPGEPDLSTLVARTGLPLILDTRPDYRERIAEAARWWHAG